MRFFVWVEESLSANSKSHEYNQQQHHEVDHVLYHLPNHHDVGTEVLVDSYELETSDVPIADDGSINSMGIADHAGVKAKNESKQEEGDGHRIEHVPSCVENPNLQDNSRLLLVKCIHWKLLILSIIFTQLNKCTLVWFYSDRSPLQSKIDDHFQFSKLIQIKATLRLILIINFPIFFTKFQLKFCYESKYTYTRVTRQVSSMIHSARPIVTPVVNIVFTWNLSCWLDFQKWGWTDERTYVKTMITTSRDWGLAEWINKEKTFCSFLTFSFIVKFSASVTRKVLSFSQPKATMHATT